jgi:hypothetical protein
MVSYHQWMITLPTKSWTFTGEPPDAGWREGMSHPRVWPAWMIFMNFACDREKIVIHTWEGVLTAHVGDTIHQNSVGVVTIVRAEK